MAANTPAPNTAPVVLTNGQQALAKFKSKAADIIERSLYTFGQAFLGVLVTSYILASQTSPGDSLFVTNHDWLHRTFISAIAAGMAALASVLKNLVLPKVPQPL